MGKGNEAKTNLMNKIVAALGENYIGEFEKKHYFWSTENGEQVQVAISMTCPKNPVAVVNTSPSDELNFEDFTEPKETKSMKIKQIKKENE